MDYRKLFDLNARVRTEKERLADQLRSEKPIIFSIMDVMFIFIFIFNIGALTLTNLAVTKEKVDTNVPIELKEVNPIQAKINGYELHPDYMSLIYSFMKQMFFYAIMIIGYWTARFKIYTPTSLYILFGVVFYYVVLTSMDCFNDFGLVWGMLS